MGTKERTAGMNRTASRPSPHPKELERFLRLEHPDPHSILGSHVVAGGTIIRAFRPDATAMEIVEKGMQPRKMEQIHPAGLYEIWYAGRTQHIPYRFRVHYPGPKKIDFRDPYQFMPTLGELDVHLAQEGTHERLYEKLGSHVKTIEGTSGVAFAVWAPSAKSVSVVGDFNSWDGRVHPMRVLGSSGIWELFIPELEEGARYKYEIRTGNGKLQLRADPMAQLAEMPPGTASVIYQTKYDFGDQRWCAERRRSDRMRKPLSIYEVHLGSWRRSEEGAALGYREIAEPLASYAKDMGFTHVQFMPLMEHPFGGSWGYQVSGYFAPTARYGTPDDFRYLVDYLHQQGVGVILDWVPAHFPRDEFALGRFDGTALFEHEDPRQGAHPDWGTLVFNYGRTEVVNFLICSALYWLREFHVDGLRLDAVASMLYLDYSRKQGEWIPNEYGGRENLDAMKFLRRLNEVAHMQHPGVLMIAEESTAWPAVSRPTYMGGLGFGYKWNMGWMHDTLQYFQQEPIHRRYHHNKLTFGLLYAFTENFILPFSHDEVVHGKASMLGKMPGDRWQQFANLRALYGYMWAHPGKKLLFMGSEIGQWTEWNHDSEVEWTVLLGEEHRGLQNMVRDLNRLYQNLSPLWRADFEPEGFTWLDSHNGDENVVAFMRNDPHTARQLISISNFSPVVRYSYRIGLPKAGEYREIINTDSQHYEGSNVGNQGGIQADSEPWQGQPFSATMVLPPLATVWLEVPEG